MLASPTRLVTGAALAAAASRLAAPLGQDAFAEAPSALVEGEAVALARSGFREGRHPDRGDGTAGPRASTTREACWPSRSPDRAGQVNGSDHQLNVTPIALEKFEVAEPVPSTSRYQACQ